MKGVTVYIVDARDVDLLTCCTLDISRHGVSILILTIGRLVVVLGTNCTHGFAAGRVFILSRS